ncbi:ubiquitin-like-conjugating enzyme ATG10 isoform X1 [Clinocottus analis]|uniref:ubiquitin-like-conjugating enzyme ATG10 isoform X1 n=1 Tax=Clinocottus analis TaxID=304258 RepID=UPI0035C25C9A
MSCCPLKEDDFRRCCLLFVQWSDHLRDGWSWEVVQGSEEGYLRKIALRLAIIAPSPARDQTGSGSDSEAHTSCTEPRGREEEQSGLGASVNTDSACGDIADDEEEVDEGDGVCAVSGCSSQVLQYEYHILHSCSYATPVLYFRAFTQEGRSLSLEEVWSSVHPNFRLRLQSSPLDTITLQDGGVHAARAAGGSGTTQAGELRAVVAQCCWSCGGSGCPSEVLQPALLCGLSRQRHRAGLRLWSRSVLRMDDEPSNCL